MIKKLWWALAYAVVFLLQYRLLTVPLFAYWGFGNITDYREYLYVLPMMVFPAAFMPGKIEKPSELLAVLNYAILYVPLCVLLFHSTKTSISLGDLWAIWSALVASTLALFGAVRLPVFAVVKPAADGRAILLACWCVVAVVVLCVLAVNAVRIITFNEIAATRSAYSMHIRVYGALFGYLDAWVGLALIPFLFADSLRRGRMAACAGLAALCALLFLLSGRKTDLLCPAAVFATYWAVKRKVEPAGVLLALSGLMLLPFLFRAAGLAGPSKILITVVNFRIFAVPQILVPQYYGYYLAQGFTHFRHVNLVNRLFYGGAPFEQPWSAIAHFYYKKDFTADAVFYATDGLAAMGMAGIPCVTAALIAVFWAFDSLKGRHSSALVLPALMPFLFSLFNNSLFTSMLTGGGFLLMLLFYLSPVTP